jgi:hypothetical protein
VLVNETAGKKDEIIVDLHRRAPIGTRQVDTRSRVPRLITIVPILHWRDPMIGPPIGRTGDLDSLRAATTDSDDSTCGRTKHPVPKARFEHLGVYREAASLIKCVCGAQNLLGAATAGEHTATVRKLAPRRMKR